MATTFDLGPTLTAIRNYLRDSVAPYRFTDSQIYDCIWEAQAEIMRRCPQSVPAGTTIAKTPLVSQAYTGAVTAYAAAKALMDDAEEGSMVRAKAFFDMFENSTKGW